ncbi:unnamed protein product [Prunus armeniaca]
MSSSSSPAQTKRCQYYGAAMVLRGATSCNGFKWVDVTFAQAEQQDDTYDATVLNMLKSIKDLVDWH